MKQQSYTSSTTTKIRSINVTRIERVSASSTASGSGQQKGKQSIPDDESRMQVKDTLEMGSDESTALPGASSANTGRRVVVK